MSLILGAATASAQQPPKAPALVLDERPIPATVKLTHLQKLTAAPLKQIAVAPLPDYLADAIVVTRPIAKYAADPEAGKLQVEVLADGPLFLAVSDRYDGFIPDASWWSAATFGDNGWVPLQWISLVNTASNKPETYKLYLRDCRAGEQFIVRPRMYQPPLLLVPAAGAPVPNLATWVPEPALPEAFQYEAIRAQSVSLLTAERFDELEKLVDGYLQIDAHFPSGASKFLQAAELFEFVGRKSDALHLAHIERLEKWRQRKPDSIAAKLVLLATVADLYRYYHYRPELDNSAALADEAERRCAELLHEAEQSGSTAPGLYYFLVSSEVADRWDEALALKYLNQHLPAGRWCPEVVNALFRSYVAPKSEELPDPQVTAAKVASLFELTRKHLGPRFGDAMYAAIFAQWYRAYPTAAFRSGHFDWTRGKPAFEDWNRHFPDSRRVKQLYCLFACAAGDRDTARRLFAELGEFKYDVAEVWSYEPDMHADRIWSAADFSTGDQRQLIEHPVETVGGLAWVDEGRRLLWADANGYLYRYDIDDVRKPEYVKDMTIQSANSLATTPDGNRVLVGARLTDLALRDFAQDVKRGLRSQHGDVEFTSLSTDGNRAAAGYADGYVALFDVTNLENRKPTHELRVAGEKPLRAVRLSADGVRGYVVGSTAQVVRFNFADGAVLNQWSADPKGCSAAAVDAERDRIVTAVSGNRLTLWNAADGTPLWQVPMKGPTATRAALSPNGRFVAVGTGLPWRLGLQEIRLYAAADGKLLKTYAGHKAGITDLAFSPDGRTLASSSLDRSIRLWDVPQE